MTTKMHLALNVRNLDDSLRFYRAFFGFDPVKLKPGYAKFDVAEPALNLTLTETPDVQPGAVNHLGIQVPSTRLVDEAGRRLERAGLKTKEERNVDCCHALQDKVWVADPDGNAWEVFTVKVADTSPQLESRCC